MENNDKLIARLQERERLLGNYIRCFRVQRAMDEEAPLNPFYNICKYIADLFRNSGEKRLEDIR